MKARDVMTPHVISVGPDLPIQAVANTLVKNGISAVPVVSLDGKLLGIVSEGDLLHRVETDTERRRSWWLEMVSSGRTLASEFVKSHGLTAGDVMTTEVVTMSPDSQLSEIADVMERQGCKRVPIVENGQIVGVVSRANLVQALATGMKAAKAGNSDEGLREAIIAHLRQQPWGQAMINVIVRDGEVGLWGVVDSEIEKKAVRIAVEGIPGVREIKDNLRVHRIGSGE